MAGPLQPVGSPAFIPSRYGLLSTVAPATPTDVHWQGGVQYVALCPTGGTTFEECIVVTGSGGAPPPPGAKSDNVDLNHRAATPFTVVAEFDCAPATFGSPDEVRRLADEALGRVEEWQVERAFWTGAAGGQRVVFPHLAEDETITAGDGVEGSPLTVTLNTAATVVTGGGASTTATRALGVIERELANCYKGEGIIHIPPLLVPSFGGSGLIYRDGAVLRTWNGNRVVAGGGYPGTSPGGGDPSPGQSWIYATGQVFAYRSTVLAPAMPSVVDRIENTVRAIAERTYLLGWDCCHLATLVDVGGVS